MFLSSAIPTVIKKSTIIKYITLKKRPKKSERRAHKISKVKNAKIK